MATKEKEMGKYDMSEEAYDKMIEVCDTIAIYEDEKSTQSEK